MNYCGSERLPLPLAHGKTNDLKALRKMVGEAHDRLRTTNLPEERSQRAYGLLTASSLQQKAG